MAYKSHPSSTLPPYLRKITYTRPDDCAGYPFSVPLFQKDFELELSTPITLIVGENGSGKSTLLEAIAHACGFNVRGGNRNHHYAPEKSGVSHISEALRLSWLPKISEGFFFRAESFIQFGDYLDELAQEEGAHVYDGYGGQSLHAQSHGESFLTLFTSKLTRSGLFLLDEPEAALSPMRQLALLSVLFDLQSRGNSQVIMATHSPLLMAFPGAKLLFLEGDSFVEMRYKETPHYALTRRFLDNPEKYLSELQTASAD
jgi:predicted ATPase